jgi:sulfur carrier protein ThiS
VGCLDHVVLVLPPETVLGPVKCLQLTGGKVGNDLFGLPEIAVHRGLVGKQAESLTFESLPVLLLEEIDACAYPTHLAFHIAVRSGFCVLCEESYVILHSLSRVFLAKRNRGTGVKQKTIDTIDTMERREIDLFVNGLKEKAPVGCNISFLISHFKEDDAHLIVEHNGRFVYPQEYERTVVSNGDRIEFINPNFGG